MFLLVLFLLGFAVSAVAISYAVAAAHRRGIVDRPGGHKAHDTVTPFVGGVGVLTATLFGLVVVGQFYDQVGSRIYAFLFGVLAMFCTGFADDIFHLNYKIRFVVQTAVGLVMVFWGGVVISDLGYLFSDQPVQLGIVAVPLTVIATIGAINALNMIDGIDGLSGSLSIVSLLLIAVAVYLSGDAAYFSLVIVMAGGVAGFLYFNLRYLSRRRARCFLGDNGSMLLGFVFAWLLADLSQMNDGSPRAITPITTLWLFSVPLIDTLCVMLRRMWMGRSPFHADRHHLHHLFLRAGFRVQDTVVVLAFLQACFGATGLLGMYAGVGEGNMLIAFICVFVICFYVLLRPWRLVPLLRRIQRLLGFTSVHAVGVHVSGLKEGGLAEFSSLLNSTLGPYSDFRFTAYRPESGRDAACYGLIELLCDDQDQTQAQISRIIAALRREVRGEPGIRIRQFVERKDVHERRVGRKGVASERRRAERRSAGKAAMIYCVDSAAGEASVLER